MTTLDDIFKAEELKRKYQKKADRIKQVIALKVLGKIIPKHDEFGHHYEFVGLGEVVDSVTMILQMIEKEHIRYWAVKKGIEWLGENDRWKRLFAGPVVDIKDADRKELLKGAQFAHRDNRDDAAAVGHQAHSAVENYVNMWIKHGNKPPDIRLFFKTVEGRDPFGYYLEEHNKSIVETDLRAIAAARAIEKLFRERNIIPIAAEILVGIPGVSAGTLDFLCLLDGELAIIDFKTSNFVDDQSYPLQVSAYETFLRTMTGLRIKKLRIIKMSKDQAKFEDYFIPNKNQAYKAFKNLASFYSSWYSKMKEFRVQKYKESITLK